MYLTIYFGLELEDKVIPHNTTTQGGIHYHGPKGLLLLLESHLGQIGYSENTNYCLLYTSPSPRDRTRSRMPSSA